MPHQFRFPRLFSVVLGCLAACAAFAFWQAPRCRAAQEAAKPIDAADLLRSTAFDRITLIDKTVLIIDPVSPRPLPVYDPKAERERQRRGVVSPENMPFEIGQPHTPTHAKPAKGDEEGAEGGGPRDVLKIHLFEETARGSRDFQVKRSSIQKIEYFEDLLLAESDRLVRARDFARAFECCLRVKLRNPKWAGLDERVNRVLFAEGSQALVDGDAERGLRLLRELLGRKREFPGLLDQIASAYGKRIERALQMGLFLHGRRVLRELDQLMPEHAAVAGLRARFIAKANDHMKEAEAASAPARLDHIVEALRTWPALEGADEQYRRAFAACPTLRVGVTDVAVPLGPWIHSRADARVVGLLYRPVLAADTVEARKGEFPGQLAASVESSDLGRRLVLNVRSDIVWSDGSRPASASDIAHALINRSDPHSPSYEARWAEMLDRVEVRDDARVEVRLNRAPLRAGGWLLGPVGPAHVGPDGRVATSAGDRALVTDGPYRCALSSDKETVLLQNDGPPSIAPANPPANGHRPARIREIRVPPGRASVGALMRGEVALLEHVPPSLVAELSEAADVQMGRYTAPVVHLLALDGRNPLLRNRALRRGLSYAIDRRALMEGLVLRRPLPDGGNDDDDAPADGAFARSSYANAPDVKPLEGNMLLARMLVTAGRNEMGVGPIKLKLEYPALDEARAVVGKLVESFHLAGAEVTPIERSESQLESELRAGRRFDLAYRVVRSKDPVLDAGPLLCPGYDAPPETDPLGSVVSPRILQLLLQLEAASDWTTARGLAVQIDRETRDELPVVPLWQLVDHYAWRGRLTGPGKTAEQLYEGLETWSIAPWYARDPWDAASQKGPSTK